MKTIKVSVVAFTLFMAMLPTVALVETLTYAEGFAEELCNTFTDPKITCVVLRSKQIILIGMNPSSLSSPIVAKSACNLTASNIIGLLNKNDFAQKIKRELQSGWEIAMRGHNEYGHGETRVRCEF